MEYNKNHPYYSKNSKNRSSFTENLLQKNIKYILYIIYLKHIHLYLHTSLCLYTIKSKKKKN